MTPLLITLLCRELKRSLPSRRISHIGQEDGETFGLTLYRPEKGNLHLVLALTPLHPLLFLSPKKSASQKKPSSFLSSLRKHLAFARVEEVEQRPGERIMILRLTAGGSPYALAFEALPKYPNLILLGPGGDILSALHYKDEVERPVLPGAPYATPPQPLGKPSLWELDADALKALWEKEGRPDLRGFLKDSVRGTDPESARWLAEQGDGAFESAEHMRERALHGTWDAFRVVPTAGGPSLRLFPGTPGEGDEGPFPDVHAAAARAFRMERDFRLHHQERRKLELEIQRALKREQRILGKLKDDRARAEKADEFQWWGELLMAQLHRVPQHASRAELPDVVRGTDRPVAIDLDPGLTAVQNAQHFFRKARKGVRGLTLVEKREREVLERIHELKSAQRSLPALAHPDEIRKAYRELFRPARTDVTPPPKEKEPRVPTPNIHREKAGREFEICAGGSAVANEYITFQLAQPDDLWFHARDVPGSHVILRRLTRNAKFTDELVMRAARYAAGRCKAGPNSKVTVSYTEKKYVRRIPGAPAGMVTMSKERSMVVDLSVEPIRLPPVAQGKAASHPQSVPKNVQPGGTSQ